jgi:hypothetical protein
MTGTTSALWVAHAVPSRLQMLLSWATFIVSCHPLHGDVIRALNKRWLNSDNLFFLPALFFLPSLKTRRALQKIKEVWLFVH